MICDGSGRHVPTRSGSDYTLPVNLHARVVTSSSLVLLYPIQRGHNTGELENSLEGLHFCYTQLKIF